MPLGLFVVASALYGLWLHDLVRGLVFTGSEWELAATRRGWSVTALAEPWGGSLQAVPLAIYNGLFEWKGLSTYNHYAAMLVAAHLVAGLAMFAAAARRAGTLVALGAALVLLAAVSIPDVRLWPLNVGVPLAVAFGLTGWMAWDTDRAVIWRDVAGAVALALAVATHPLGIAMFLASATVMALSTRTNIRLVWPAGVLASLVAWLVVGDGWDPVAWIATLGERVAGIPAHVLRVAGSLGLVGAEYALLILVPISVLGGVAIGRGVRPGARFWSPLVLAVALALVAPLESLTSDDAYLYGGIALLLLAVAELTALERTWSPRARRIVLGGGAAWSMAILVTGIGATVGAADERGGRAAEIEASLVALQLMAPTIEPPPDHLVEGDLFGSITYEQWLGLRSSLEMPAPARVDWLLAHAPSARAMADRVIVRAAASQLIPRRATAAPARRDTLPVTFMADLGATRVDNVNGACGRFHIGGSDPHVNFTLPAGGRAFVRSDGQEATQVFYRLAADDHQEAASVQRFLLPDEWFVIEPPPLADPLRWKLRVDPPQSAQRLELCVVGARPDRPFTARLDPWADGLIAPTAIAAPLDATGRLLVAERAGLIRVIENAALQSTPMLDIRNRVSTDGEQGLLGIALHPEFGSNGRYFIGYTDLAGDLRIAEVSTGSDAERPLLRIPQPTDQHNGGMLAFGPDGYLYASSGDGVFHRRTGRAGTGQEPDSWLGVILRIDVDARPDGRAYAIPSDNPRIGRSVSEVWAYGLRNPWRFSFDRETGDLWIADVGQRYREEINFEPAGSDGGLNYGWAIMEGSACYFEASCNDEGLTLPIAEYFHDDGNCAVIGGHVYRGSDQPALTGWYLFADFCSGRLWGLSEPGSEPVELLRSNRPIVTFGEDAAGELYVATFDGALLRVVIER